MKLNWYKFNRNSRTKTVGTLLSVNLPLLDIENLTAKVDTGAFSGALHASGIKEIVGADGQKQLQFTPYGSNQTVLVDKYHKRRVKSSDGRASRRYAFETEIEILGDIYLIIITLSDRSNMKNPMLVGRSFLQTHGFLVDVSINSK